jgi:uncharacterized protein DUF6933
MATLRCTTKYRKAFRIPEELAEPPPTNLRLGEWYANTLSIGQQRYLHYMASASLLSVIIPVRERKTAELRLVKAVEELLYHFGASHSAVQAEIGNMSSFMYARASNRSVLGSLRDQAYLAKGDVLEGRVASLWELWLRLAETPCGPMNYDSPEKVTRALFGVQPFQRGAV